MGEGQSLWLRREGSQALCLQHNREAKANEVVASGMIFFFLYNRNLAGKHMTVTGCVNTSGGKWRDAEAVNLWGIPERV